MLPRNYWQTNKSFPLGIIYNVFHRIFLTVCILHEQIFRCRPTLGSTKINLIIGAFYLYETPE